MSWWTNNGQMVEVWRFVQDGVLVSELVLVGIHQRFGDLSEEDLSEDGGVY